MSLRAAFRAVTSTAGANIVAVALLGAGGLSCGVRGWHGLERAATAARRSPHTLALKHLFTGTGRPSARRGRRRTVAALPHPPNVCPAVWSSPASGRQTPRRPSPIAD
jgi:hypothetical protein